MADEKEGRVVIASDRIGLPANASSDEIVDQVYRMADRLKQLEVALAESSRIAAEHKKSSEDLKALQAKVLVEEAIRNKWIDKSEEQYFIEDYVSDPVRTQKRIDDRKYRTILTKHIALRGEAPEVDVEVEIDDAAQKLMASEPRFKDKPAMARLEVLKRDKTLSEKYRDKQLGAQKGGDR